MPIAALAVAAAAYALEFWSAVYAYPIDSGGRPLNSWPIFLLVPFDPGQQVFEGRRLLPG